MTTNTIKGRLVHSNKAYSSWQSITTTVKTGELLMASGKGIVIPANADIAANRFFRGADSSSLSMTWRQFVFTKNDNSGYPTYHILFDVTDWATTTTNVGPNKGAGIAGILTNIRLEGYSSTSYTTNLVAVCSYNNSSLTLQSTSSYARPYVLYNSTEQKYYLALRVTGSKMQWMFSGTISGVLLAEREILTTDINGTLPTGWSIFKSPSYMSWPGSAGILATSRTLWGQSFNGSANVSGAISNTGNITSATNNSYELGSSSNYWKNLYATNIYSTNIYSTNINDYPIASLFYINKSGETVDDCSGSVIQTQRRASLHKPSTSTFNKPSGEDDGTLLSLLNGGDTGFQMYAGYNMTTQSMYWRGFNHSAAVAGIGSNWRKILDTTNAFVTDIHNSTDTTKTATAKQIWTECEKRNVSADIIGDYQEDSYDEDIDNESMLDLYTYGIGWTENTNTPVRVGNQSLHTTLPIQNALRACVTKGDNTAYTLTQVDNTGVTRTINYGQRQVFQYWLDPDDWSKKLDGTASVLNGDDNTNVMIYNPVIYYKSWKNVASQTDHHSTGTWNEVRMSTKRIDSTWNVLKAGYTSFGKMMNVSSKARCYGSPTWGTINPRDTSAITPAESKTWFQTINTAYRPLVSTSRYVAQNYAVASGMHLLDLDEYSILFYWLPAIEFNTFLLESRSIMTNAVTGLASAATVYRPDSFIDSWLSTIQCGWPKNNTNYWYNINNGTSSSVGIYNYLPNGYSNQLGSHTGWVRLYIPDSSDNIEPVTRYRGFELHRNIWTNTIGDWAVKTATATQAEFFTTKNRALFNTYIPINDIANSGNYNNGAVSTETLTYKADHSYNVISNDVEWCATGYVNDTYVGDWVLGSRGLLISSRQQSEANSKFDYNYGKNQPATGLDYASNPRCLRFGGAADNGANGGPGYLTFYDAGSCSGATVGFRCRFNIDEYSSIYN